MAIKVPSEIIPNATDQKVTDAKYVKYTHHEGESDEEIMTQSSINESVLDGNIFKTINGNSIVGEGNIYTSTDSYVVCNSAASDNPKVITINNYQQVNGGNIRIKFTKANTAAPASGEDAVKLKIMTGTSTYVDGYLYYNNSPVNATNGWSAGETVTVYYDDTTDAEKYMANNAAGAELIDASQVDTEHPDTKKGLTEEAIVSVLGDIKKEQGSYVTLQDQIYEISASSSTVGIALYDDGQGSKATTRLVGDSGSTDTHKIYGTCIPSKSQMTLYRRANGAGSWESVGGPTTATNNSGENLYQHDVASDTPIRYDYFIRNHIYSTDKDTTSPLYIYYVLNTYYGALPTMTEGEDPEPIIYTLDDLIGTNGHTRQLTPSLRINSKGTYSMPFDTRARKVYMVCPKAIVTTINPTAVYWMSVISSNIMPFTRDTSMENTDYYVYISDNTYTVDPAGSRNIIFQ